MADTMQFDLVAPERNLMSVAVREVRLPGENGDLSAMPGHAPAIVNLRPGLVTVIDEQGAEHQFAISGGFAEINNESLSLLAEIGRKRDEMTQDVFDDMMRSAQRKKKAAEQKEEQHGAEGVVAAAAKLLADMEALGSHIGLSAHHSTAPD
ncbi:F-type H+-transporting ATPase subunit epsilon [Paracoccus isoporae]|uniref:ATP synthase epsilon chain n=1 Tax=Paracoccus isoporae TaxID=591205 RepID=A0A1G7BLW9_9RHOB|nr:ATP synthase F1 subunit epsilon [Paracoccus isoporae]SDE27690.1 F-type H+-transporting ATPase subunit epsilon [Paracoccus isoporae]